VTHFDASLVVADRQQSVASLDANERLDEQFRVPLMAYFQRRIRDRGEAEDLTQEVFVRLIAKAEPLAADTAAAYVFTIAANLLKDRARRAGVRPIHAHQSIDDPQCVPMRTDLIEEIGPERVLLGKEKLREAMNALNELGEGTREIFVLSRLEKMRLRDIAALFGLSVPAVERRIMKASTHVMARLEAS
jgi:RNA polymerase sigma-70 factor (ECF subfamily)